MYISVEHQLLVVRRQQDLNIEHIDFGYCVYALWLPCSQRLNDFAFQSFGFDRT